MKRSVFLATVITAVVAVVIPFVGSTGVSFATEATPQAAIATPAATTVPVVTTGPVTVVAAAPAKATTAADVEHVAQTPIPKPKPKPKPVAAAAASSAAGARTSGAQRRASLARQGKVCPSNVGGGTGSAPGRVSAKGVHGTTSADLSAFARTFNSIRVANCVRPIPLANFHYDSCMEQRLFWMAEDPSTNPASAWGHMGSKRSDGVPSVGCDGNLAGGSGNTGATVATKWWNSLEHRASLYRPSFDGDLSHVCIAFAMSHGGIPNEPTSFTRAAARWVSC